MPTVFRLIDVRRQFVTAAGVPLSGGKLNFYTAGTSTRKDTYADAGGTTANSNPVVLNSQGFPDVGIYGTTGAYKIVLTDSADAVIWTDDSVTPINDVSNAAQTEWTDHNGTPTYISATSFSVTGDHTATFHVGRRVRTTNSGGTKVYSYVATVSHSAGVTTVTLTNDSGSLDSGLSAVSYGLLDSTNHSLPMAAPSFGATTVTSLTVTTGGITVSAGGITVTGNSTIAGTLGGLTGLTVASGGASITGNTTVGGGTFATRGFADNATAAAWNIDASGRLLNNGGAQPFLKVSRSSDQTSGTTVIFNSEAIDRGGQYDNTTGIWTVPVSGDYGLRGVLTIGNSSGASGARIVTIAGSTTGTVYSCRAFFPTGEPVAIPLNIDATLVAAETVTVTVDIAFTANFLLEANRCFFSARLLG